MPKKHPSLTSSMNRQLPIYIGLTALILASSIGYTIFHHNQIEYLKMGVGDRESGTARSRAINRNRSGRCDENRTSSGVRIMSNSIKVCLTVSLLLSGLGWVLPGMAQSDRFSYS